MHVPTDRAPTHPGEMLREEFLPDLGLTQQELAARLGISFRRVNEILNEKRPVTMDTALRLARLFDMEVAFWLNLQLAYDLYQAMHGPLSEEIRKQVQPLRVA
jgi:addiction module HigA family antidote